MRRHEDKMLGRVVPSANGTGRAARNASRARSTPGQRRLCIRPSIKRSVLLMSCASQRCGPHLALVFPALRRPRCRRGSTCMWLRGESWTSNALPQGHANMTALACVHRTQAEEVCEGEAPAAAAHAGASGRGAAAAARRRPRAKCPLSAAPPPRRPPSRGEEADKCMSARRWHLGRCGRSGGVHRRLVRETQSEVRRSGTDQLTTCGGGERCGGASGGGACLSEASYHSIAPKHQASQDISICSPACVSSRMEGARLRHWQSA
jgi:hypothetical protein